MDCKLLFLDMEGTLFAKQRVQLREGDTRLHHSLWSRLMHELGPEAAEEDAENLARWEAGGYESYFQWVGQSARNLRKHGLTRDLFHEVMESVPYNPEVPETLAALHERGLRTCIVSGGFYDHARKALRELKVNHAFAAIDLFWDEEGRLSHWNLFPTDYEGKIDFVRLLKREYRLQTEDCAFVGDGKNDVHIAREVGAAFAYDAHPDLVTAADYSIESFADLLGHL